MIGNELNQPVFWQPQFDAGVRTRPRRPSALPRLRVRLAEGRRPGARRRRRRPRPAATIGRPRGGNISTSPCASSGHSATGTGRAGAHDRSWTASAPSLPAPGHRPARSRLLLAERRLRQPRPLEAGALGRVPRHPAADDARGPEAVPGRGRLAGDTSRRAGYLGRENVPVTDEITQAAIYGDSIRRAACDADIAAVSFFGFRDDSACAGFQAALLRRRTARPAGGRCGTPSPRRRGAAPAPRCAGSPVTGSSTRGSRSALPAPRRWRPHRRRGGRPGRRVREGAGERGRWRLEPRCRAALCPRVPPEAGPGAGPHERHRVVEVSVKLASRVEPCPTHGDRPEGDARRVA